MERRPVYVAAPPEQEPGPVTWFPNDFLDRFTKEERGAFTAAALTDPDIISALAAHNGLPRD